LELQTARQAISEAPKLLAKVEENNKRLTSTLTYHTIQMEVIKMEKDTAESKLVEALSTVSNLRSEIKSHTCPVVREASPEHDVDQSFLYSFEDTSVAQEQVRLMTIRLEDQIMELDKEKDGRLVYEREIQQLTVLYT
jgi:translation elongation factor EF-Tu-like GTPase